jgi:hypothetical protein
MKSMGRLWGGVALLFVALFMLVGFLRADLGASAAVTALAFLIGVGLPAAGGAALLRGHFGASRTLAARRDQLRQQTLDSEVLRLAGRRGGKLTVVEVVSDLGVSTEDAKETLDGLMMRELAEIEITDAGMLVYRFRDVEQLPEKHRSRGLLDG